MKLPGDIIEVSYLYTYSLEDVTAGLITVYLQRTERGHFSSTALEHLCT